MPCLPLAPPPILTHRRCKTQWTSIRTWYIKALPVYVHDFITFGCERNCYLIVDFLRTLNLVSVILIPENIIKWKHKFAWNSEISKIKYIIRFQKLADVGLKVLNFEIQVKSLHWLNLIKRIFSEGDAKCKIGKNNKWFY